MTKLSKQARETIKYFDIWSDYKDRITIAGYVRYYYGDQGWGGDSCGCVDNRCKDGYHHEPYEECHCLESWLESYDKARRAGEAS